MYSVLMASKFILTARFSAPIEIGGLKTADPLNEEVQQWWKEKVKEIYSLIPDFGGFLVKANMKDNRVRRIINEHMLMVPICWQMQWPHIMEL